MKRGVVASTIGGSMPAPEKTTEEQARAIMCAARRAVEVEAKRGDDDCGAAAAPRLSLKKSLQWFLEGRKNKAMAAAGGIHPRRAVEVEAKRGDDDCGAAAAPRLSLKKSLQWFLEGRKNKAMAAAGGIHRQL